MHLVRNQLFSIIELAIRRTLKGIGSYLAVATGVLVATTAICAVMIYAESVNVLILREQLDQAHREATYDLLIQGKNPWLDQKGYANLTSDILNQVENRIGLPVTRVDRHGWSKSLLFIPPGLDPTGKREDLPSARLQFYSNLKDQVEVVEGAYPQPVSDPQSVLQVMMTQVLVDKLQIKVGDVFQLEDFKGGAQSVRLNAQLTAIIRVHDEETAWFYAPWFLDEAITLPEESFFQAVSLAVVPVDAEFVWAVNYDEKAVNLGNVKPVLSGIQVLKFNLKEQLGGLQLLTKLDSLLQNYQRDTFVLMALLVVLGAPAVVLALYYIFMSSELLVEYQRGEIAVLKSRGSSNLEVTGVFIVQGLLVVVPVTLIAPFLAVWVARWIGKAETFMSFTNPRSLPVILHPVLFGYAALAGLLALFAILLPALNATRQTIVTYRREAARGKRTFIIHRYYLDVLLIVLGALGYRMLTQNRSIITRTAAGGLKFDPLLLLTPIALTAGMTFLSLRLLPLLFQLLARLDAYTSHVAPLFALRQIARSASRYNGLILILTFTLALGLFTTTVANVFDLNYRDQAMYAAGADLRTHEFDYKTASWTTRPLSAYQSIPGVVTASPAARIGLVGRSADILAKGYLLGIVPESFAQVAWWRDDFTPPLVDILNMLQTRENSLVADARFVQKNRLEIGDTFDIDVDGRRVDFVLAGTFDSLFPTLYPADGDRLLARLDYLQQAAGTRPSEIWMATQPSQHEKVVAALKESQAYNLVVVEDGHQLSGVRKDDPLRTGLFGALSLSFISASLLSILGFLLYAYISVQTRGLQFGVLRATGLSIRQLIEALSTEQLSLILTGILLGSLFGGAASWTFIRFLQVSIVAKESVPAFLVTTPWGRILILYAILFTIFSSALAVSVYLLRRMRVATVLRLGEE